MEIKEAIHKLIGYRRFIEKMAMTIPGYIFDAEPFDLAISALEFKERYDNFWEEVKAAGMKGKRDGDTSQRKGVQNQRGGAMTNAEKFKQLFGIYATELWAMPEEKFLEWLNAEALEKQEQDRWTPCKEKMPAKPFGCFVTVMDTNPITQEEFENILPYFVGWDGEQWNDADGERIPCEVIAWRPLPAPYQEDEA